MNLVLASLLFCSSVAAQQDAFIPPHPALSAEHTRTIESGGQVFITVEAEGSAWPRVYIYQFIDALPEDAAAVFADYESHKTFIPNLRRSAVTQVIDRASMDVEYILRIPVFADERYTLRDQVSAYDDGASYEVRWSLVKASSTRATEGNLRFEPYTHDGLRRQGTLMAYYNFIIPGSRLAGIGFIKRKGLDQLRETAHAIVRQVESARERDPLLLQNQLTALRAALTP